FSGNIKVWEGDRRHFYSRRQPTTSFHWNFLSFNLTVAAFLDAKDRRLNRKSCSEVNSIRC
uniref:Uncharacterized protein n=1 Tax=Ascaris lumbricoides TaxID=6252 RepID=A0A0M3IF65_ASCLU